MRFSIYVRLEKVKRAKEKYEFKYVGPVEQSKLKTGLEETWAEIG